MKLVIFGLSVSSSWGNGHATLWRGLCRALAARGHRVVFFERDTPYYSGHRDLTELPGGELILYLNRPGAGGAGQAMPDGTLPAPGGWNRIQIEIDDLTTEVARLRAAGARFRNEIVAGAGGAQILVQDPSGNLIELFEPKR